MVDVLAAVGRNTSNQSKMLGEEPLELLRLKLEEWELLLIFGVVVLLLELELAWELRASACTLQVEVDTLLDNTVQAACTHRKPVGTEHVVDDTLDTGMDEDGSAAQDVADNDVALEEFLDGCTAPVQ